MLTTISQYLKQRIQALNYIQQVYGIGQLLQVNGEQVPSIKINGEDTHVNFDNYKSLVFFLKNGNVGHSAEEHPFLANADLITKTYPLRLILYSQVLENTDCNSLSQSLADNIISALNGEQAAFKASVSVDRCRIEFGNTDLEKYSVWESLYSIDSVLKDADVLIAIEFTVTITGLESCFIDSPCETPEFTFDLDGQTFCEKVQTCLGISPTGSATEYLNRQGEWATPAGGGGSGTNGWTPVLAIVTDGTRRVQQVTDWTGGTGTKPATGQYVGAGGLVSNIADAVDIRGAQGATGTTGATGPQGPQGEPGTVSLVSGNGTTFDTDHYDLGGELTQNTVLEFNPQQKYMVFGSLALGKGIVIGDINGEESFDFAVVNADAVSINTASMVLNATSNVELNGETVFSITVNDPISDYVSSATFDPNSATPGTGMALQKSQDYEVGFFAIDNGIKKFSNIYYGILDNDNIIQDVTRVEVNESAAHMRHIYDLNSGFFNGVHVAPTYSQLEYGKEQEDDQLTGINLTVNATGVHHYEGGFIVNSFDNFGNFTIGDPTTDGAWRTYRDNDNNLLTQARVSGAWVTIQQLNYP